jgi:peptidoglycan/xylan/chitin deacetylase (PgdA/CDA1 family)
MWFRPACDRIAAKMTGAVPILMYHVVDVARSDAERRICCPPEEFARQMSYLADNGWRVLSLSDLVAAIQDKSTLPTRTVVITFDDGTACTLERAFPILARHGFPATVFVVAGLVGGKNEWMCRDGHPSRTMLSSAQLRELAGANVEVGSHTITHPRLAGLAANEVAREVFDSKLMLEDLLGRNVAHFAYPYGSYDEAALNAVRGAGYRAACSTVMGRNRVADSNLLALRRTEIRGTDALWQFGLKLRSATHDMPPWSIPRAAAKRILVRAGMLRSTAAIG